MIPRPTRRLVIISGVVASLVFVALITFFIVKSQTPEVAIESVTTSSNPELKVDYGTYKNTFSDNERRSIDQAIENQLKITKQDLSRIDTAVAREGTYGKDMYEGKIPRVRLIFDIEDIQTSYLMTLDGGESYDVDILYVRCAEKAEQMNPTMECRDVTE